MRYTTPLLDEEALAEAAPMTFASMVVRLKHVESQAMMGVIRNVTTQQGGLVQPIQSRPGDKGAVLVVDYVHNLRKILAMIRELDHVDELPVVRLEVAHADIVEVGDAILHILEVSGLRVAKVPSARSLILSGPPETVRRAVRLANELDQAANPTKE
jgi:type II secretory pathway component GspD/PulD (secretin)